MYKTKLILYIVIHIPYNMFRHVLYFIIHTVKNIFCENTPPSLNNRNIIWRADDYDIVPTPLDLPPI